VLLFQKCQPPLLLVCGGFRLCGLRKRQVVERVRAVHRFGLAARLEALRGVLSDRLQHHKARFLVLPAYGSFGSRRQQAVVHQRRQPLQDVPLFGPIRAGATNRLRRLQGKAAGEDGETTEQCLLTGIEEVVAPRDRVAQRVLPLR